MTAARSEVEGPPANAPVPDAPAPDAPAPVSRFTADVPIPPRSRTFSDGDARAVLGMLDGTGEGRDGKPAANVGYGLFDTSGAARSAGEALNGMLMALGAPHRYKVSVRDQGDKFQGIIMNEPATQRADSGPDDPTTADPKLLKGDKLDTECKRLSINGWKNMKAKEKRQAILTARRDPLNPANRKPGQLNPGAPAPDAPAADKKG